MESKVKSTVSVLGHELKVVKIKGVITLKTRKRIIKLIDKFKGQQSICSEISKALGKSTGYAANVYSTGTGNNLGDVYKITNRSACMQKINANKTAEDRKRASKLGGEASMERAKEKLDRHKAIFGDIQVVKTGYYKSTRYTHETKEKIVARMLMYPNIQVESVANALGIHPKTVKSWLELGQDRKLHLENVCAYRRNIPRQEEKVMSKQRRRAIEQKAMKEYLATEGKK